MRLTEKVNDKNCNYDIKKGCLCKAFDKLGQLEDILDGHNIETLEELDGLLWYVKQIKDIEKSLKALDIIKTLKISVYQTRHNETGHEMCIEDEDGNLIFKTITKEEFELLKEILK